MFPRRSIKKLLAFKRWVREGVLGDFSSLAITSSGIEPAELDAFVEGRDARTEILWDLSRVVGEPVILRRHPDLKLEVVFFADTTRSMEFGSIELSKKDFLLLFLDTGIEIVEASGAKVSLLYFDHRGSLYYREVREERSRPEKLAATFSGVAPVFSVAEGLRFLRRRQFVYGTGTLYVIVVSDFLFRDDYASELRGLLGAKHTLTALRIVDPFERSPPKDMLLDIVDLETAEEVLVGDNLDVGVIEAHQRLLASYGCKFETLRMEVWQ